MLKKLINCSTCGQEIASNAKACPKCGAKNKKAFTKGTVLGTIIIIIIIGAIFGLNSDNGATSASAPTKSTQSLASSTSSSNSSSHTTKAEVVKPDPIIVSVDTLVDDLESNALNASNTYKGKYVEVTGRLSVIDSSGDYFSLDPLNDSWSFTNVLCYITKEQQSIVAEFNKDQEITVIGTITRVGEVLGYSLDVESIKY